MYSPKVWTWVFVLKDKKILIWKRKSSLWNETRCIAWWHLEFWESFEECVKRETKEEFNIEIKNVEFLWITNFITENKHYVTIFMKSEYKSWKIDISIYDEYSEWKWIDFEELNNYNLFPILKDFLDNIKNLKDKINN